MSIVAGYVRRQGGPMTADGLRRRVEDYVIVPSERSGHFLTDVRETRLGHLISKYRTGYRHQVPTVEDRDGHLLMTAGYILSHDARDKNEATQLLARCAETDGRALEECEGEFVGVFVDGPSGATHLVIDRFGAVPFFLLETDEHVFFSSNLSFLRFLADTRLEMDIMGWVQIAAWGHAIGEQTHLRGVRRLTPGAHVVVTAKETQIRQYWLPLPATGPFTEPTSAAQQIFEAFQRATAQRAAWLGKGMIALSGGLDSRLVAGALPKDSGFSAWTFVDSVDVQETRRLKVAEEVATILGLAHAVKPIPKGVLSPTVVRDLIALTGGLIPVHHSVKTLQGISLMREAGIDAQMGGAAGGSLSGAYIRSKAFVDPARTGECIGAFVDSMVPSRDADRLAQIFRRDVLRDYYPRLATTLAESLEAVEGPTAAQRVCVWKIVGRNFGFHFICPVHSHPYVSEAQPHLGYEYADLLLQLPASWLYRRSLYQFMIYQCLPSLRHVIYGNTGRRLSGTIEPPEDRDSRRLRGFVGRSLRTIVPTRRRERTFMYDLLQNPQLLDEVTDLISSLPSLAQILDVDKCVRYVRACRTGRVVGLGSDDARLLGMLATMSYSVEAFDRSPAMSL